MLSSKKHFSRRTFPCNTIIFHTWDDFSAELEGNIINEECCFSLKRDQAMSSKECAVLLVLFAVLVALLLLVRHIQEGGGSQHS